MKELLVILRYNIEKYVIDKRCAFLYTSPYELMIDGLVSPHDADFMSFFLEKYHYPTKEIKDIDYCLYFIDYLISEV